MNINLMRLKGLTLELRGIRVALERIADCLEMEMSDKGFIVRPPAPSPGEPTMEYVDEELDWARENIEYIMREDKRKEREENNGSA